MRLQGVHVFRTIAQRQQSPVDFRMQRLEPAVHLFRKTGIVRYIGNDKAAVSELCRRPAGGKNFHVKIGQSSGKINNSRFIRNADQYPFDFI